MKATSSIGSAASEKAFGLSSAAATNGQASGGEGFLAMLDGLIQTSAASGGTAGGFSQAQTNAGGSEDNNAASADATNASADEVAPDAALLETLASNPQSVATTLDAPAPVAASSSSNLSASSSDDSALITLALQAGLVAQPVQQPVVAAPAADTAPTTVSAVSATPATPADTADQATATAAILVANSTVLSVSAAASSASSAGQTYKSLQSDQDNSDTQQSAILAALFAQAPLSQVGAAASQVSGQASPVSGVAASAKPVSGSAAGTLSVPGVGTSPTLSPPAYVGNGSSSSASDDGNDDNAAEAVPHSLISGAATASFGIGIAAPADGSNNAAADNNDNGSNASEAVAVPVVAANNQANAAAIVQAFSMPEMAAKTEKDSDTNTKDAGSSALTPVGDVSTAGLTLVHQTTSAATTPAAAATTATVYTAPADQVAVIIQRAAATQTQSMTIALNPVELGKVEVKLDFAKDGSVQASVTAERPETLAMLKNDHSTLTQALHNAGLTTDSNSLSFNLKDGGQSQGQQGFTNASSYRPGSQSASSDDADTNVSTTTVQYAVSSGDNGRLDVRV